MSDDDNANGLTPDQERQIERADADITEIIMQVNTLPRHRSLSLAVTKLEEAQHWLRDRPQKTPNQ